MILNGHFLCRATVEGKGVIKNIAYTEHVPYNYSRFVFFDEKSCNNMFFYVIILKIFMHRLYKKVSFHFFWHDLLFIGFAFDLTVFNDASNW